MGDVMQAKSLAAAGLERCYSTVDDIEVIVTLRCGGMEDIRYLSGYATWPGYPKTSSSAVYRSLTRKRLYSQLVESSDLNGPSVVV